MSSSDDSDFEERIKKLDINEKNNDTDLEINILLLGETGVGKSTFINAIGNYFSQKYFRNAEDNGVSVVIPTIYDITDKNNKTHKIKLGKKIKDGNECLEVGESATQEVRTYVFPIWKGRVKVRLIDTPGIGDTRGVEKDQANCENILHYLKTLDKLHAICFLLKPTQARETIYFKYCMHQLLSMFDKTACKNIFFLFTSTRGSDYTPGDTLRILEKIVQSIKEKSEDVKISTDKNVYCFDNEAFKYLGAVEKKVKFDASIKEVNLNSWKKSATNAHSLITQLQRGSPTPYSPDNLLAINFNRRMLFFFSKLLAEISQIIEDNLTVLIRLQVNKDAETTEIENMKKSQTKKVVDVEKSKVCQPVTVCSDKKCADIFWVDGVPKWHYKVICHGTCLEVSNVRMEIVGCPQLLNCHAISQQTRKCVQCGCDYSVHMHVDYITRVTEKNVLDDKTRNIIAGKESILDNSSELIEDISIKNVELQSEYETLQTFAAGLANFLEKNAIVSFNGSFKEYIVYLINQKRSSGDSSANKSSVDELKNLQKQYEEIEKIFEEAQKNPKQSVDIDVQNFEEHIKTLLVLKHNSKEIKEFCDLEKNAREKRVSVKEYVHPDYYEGDEDVRKGARNKNKFDQKRDGNKQDGRDKKYQDRRHVNEERDKNERDSRNRNDRQSNRDRNDYQQRGRPSEQQPSPSNYPPPLMSLEAHGGDHYRTNRDHRYPPRDQQPSTSEAFKVNVNLTHTDQPRNPTHYPPAGHHPYPPYNPPSYPYQGQSPHYPQQGQPPHYPHQGQPPHYPHQGQPPHYPHHDQPPNYPYQDQPPYYPPRGHAPHYHQPSPYQRPAPHDQNQTARSANYGNRQTWQNDRRDNQGQRGGQNRRGGPDRRGNGGRRERSGQRGAQTRLIMTLIKPYLKICKGHILGWLIQSTYTQILQALAKSSLSSLIVISCLGIAIPFLGYTDFFITKH
ncbi:unnamed protein product [Phaedon cochleariae]|uniref:G domain-containing protein n=1 Tax=Phaedon cochleariae TaxID=80249 RepID=A0A9N9SHX0_PHACE|nr:unnamed protein product [Phaedon cochleariae]